MLLRTKLLAFMSVMILTSGCSEPELSYDTTFKIFERELAYCMGLGERTDAATCAQERTSRALQALGIRGYEPCIYDIAGTWRGLNEEVEKGLILPDQAALAFKAYKLKRQNPCDADHN